MYFNAGKSIQFAKNSEKRRLVWSRKETTTADRHLHVISAEQNYLSSDNPNALCTSPVLQNSVLIDMSEKDNGLVLDSALDLIRDHYPAL